MTSREELINTICNNTDGSTENFSPELLADSILTAGYRRIPDDCVVVGRDTLTSAPEGDTVERVRAILEPLGFRHEHTSGMTLGHQGSFRWIDPEPWEFDEFRSDDWPSGMTTIFKVDPQGAIHWPCCCCVADFPALGPIFIALGELMTELASTT